MQPNQDGGLASVTEGARLKNRTNSAPLVDIRRDGGNNKAQEIVQIHEQVEPELEPEHLGSHKTEGAMDEDEVAGAVGAVRQYQPFQNPEVLRSCQLL